MRTLKRNQSTVYYAKYLSKTAKVDDDGNRTGEYTVSYSNPVMFKANVSPGSGVAVRQLFGVSAEYDKTLIPEVLPANMTEESVLWVDVTPVIASDGSTTTAPDYSVRRIGKSINGVTIAVKRIK